MPKAPPFSPLRLFSPIQLGFCFILFFLPWIEMTCVPPAEAKKMPKEEIDATKKELGIDPTKPVSMVSQSGLQIATGDSSPGSDMKKIEAKAKESAKKMGGAVETEKTKTKDKDDLKGAPLLFLFPVALLAGIGVAFLPIPSLIRRLTLAGCCAAALGVVMLQALIGFPMENEIKKKTEEMKAMGGGGLMFGGGGGMPGDKAKSDTKEQDMIRVRWQIPLYLTLLLLLGAGATAFLDGGGAKPRYGRKRRPDYYDEDDDEEEEEPPPRKKRRADYDDDEDDRPPKKKPAFEVVDEPPTPKKKPRRRDDDDDDDDDRPRKRRRRDEDA